VLLLAAAGCGGKGTLGPKALQQEATGLQALAAEGGILAGDAARGRSTSVFVRVHAQYLTKAAHSSATTLAGGGPRAASLADLAKSVGPRPRAPLPLRLRSRANSGASAAALTGAATRAAKLGRERMKQFLQIALGILSAIGGFVDIGDLVFNTQAGATFGFELMWVVVIGVVGIIVYSEMCGRVAAISKRPVFDLVRERVGFSAGLGTLIASEIVNLLTCAAEVGGVAIALQLLSGLPYRFLILLAVIGLARALRGRCAVRVDRAAVRLRRPLPPGARRRRDQDAPDWSHVAHGFVPGMPSGNRLVYPLFRGRPARGGSDAVRGLTSIRPAPSRTAGGRRTCG